MGWTSTTNTARSTSSLKERLHRLCVQAAASPQCELVSLLVEEILALVLGGALLANITGAICSHERAKEDRQSMDWKAAAGHLANDC